MTHYSEQREEELTNKFTPTLMLGDCLERMKDIKTDSVDMVLTSPPYNMNLRIRNGKYCSRQIVKELSTKYQSFDDNLPMEEYFEFNKKILNECLRVSDLVVYKCTASNRQECIE